MQPKLSVLKYKYKINIQQPLFGSLPAKAFRESDNEKATVEEDLTKDRQRHMRLHG